MNYIIIIKNGEQTLKAELTLDLEDLIQSYLEKQQVELQGKKR